MATKKTATPKKAAAEVEELTSKYWICDACAKKQGLIAPDYAVTMVLGRCGHCKAEKAEFITPVCDFENPKTGRKPVWD
jgi:hypothetical protein